MGVGKESSRSGAYEGELGGKIENLKQWGGAKKEV
jgi:hypothetical protein